MHGPLWFIHKTHHIKGKHAIELNDIFILVFGSCAVFPILADSTTMGWMFWIGVGAAIYGTVYAVIHEGIVHKRLPIRLRPNNAYLKAVYKAHLAHHASIQKEKSESFGLLIVGRKYFTSLRR
jgi:beta-carotene 3-hydroxylase